MLGSKGKSAGEQLHDTFEYFRGRETQLTQVMYDALFSADPELKQLFINVDFAKQRKMLISALHYIIMNYEHRKVLERSLGELGNRHLAYGVKPEHYLLFRTCMVAAMAKVAGPKWTGVDEILWRKAFEDVTDMMMSQPKSPI